MNAPYANRGIAFIGMETSGTLRRRFQRLGIETYSGDLLPSEDGGEEMAFSADGIPLGRHLQGDLFDILDNLWGAGLWPSLGIFHPDCTFLTNSAAWAFNDPDYARYPGVGYHQRVKPETLTGAPRRAARAKALDMVRYILALPIRRKVLENPPGAIGTNIRPASQIIQPYEFGEDASKKTALWFMDKDNLPAPEMRLPIDPAARFPGRIVNGRERWSNQSDNGQNRLTPGPDRWKERARTYGGIADAMVAKWAPLI